MYKLDSSFVSTNWDLKFPCSTVQALNREISDHTSLHLGETSTNSNPYTVKFEFKKLLCDDFFIMVKEFWSRITVDFTPLER